VAEDVSQAACNEKQGKAFDGVRIISQTIGLAV